MLKNILVFGLSFGLALGGYMPKRVEGLGVVAPKSKALENNPGWDQKVMLKHGCFFWGWP